MSNYNPNSVWDSKQEKFEYTAPADRGKPTEQNHGPILPSDGKKSGGHGLIWFGAGLIVLLGAAAAIVIVIKNKPTPQVAVTLNVQNGTLVGTPFVLAVSYTNNSNLALNNAKLSVFLPAGVSFLGQATGQRVVEQAVGTVLSGAASSTSFNLIATGNPNSVQHIQATMTYSASNDAKAQFQSIGQTDVAIGATALNFNFEVPQSVFSGQNFPITVNYANQSPSDMDDVMLVMSYPNNFHFVSSSRPILAGSSNNSLDLGAIKAGATSSVTVSGNLSGPTNAPYAFSGVLNGIFGGQTYPVLSQLTNLSIAQAPLSLVVTLNGTSSYVSTVGDQLNYTIIYTNTSNITFQSAIISTKLTGTMFDFSKLHSNGSFSSLTNTITWNAANDPSLASIVPGQTGSLNFSLNTKSAYPIRLVSDKNFSLKTLTTLFSPTVPQNTGGSGTQSVIELDNKVGGEVAITAKGYVHDPSGITSSGPYPPRVNQATHYTVHWQLVNYATDLSNVSLSASLQSGSQFVNGTTTVASSTLNYDAGTGLVTWTIPTIPATTGILSKSPEAVFEVSNTPAINQVGQSVTLVGPTSLTGTDVFTGRTLSASNEAITTQLPDDSTVSGVSNKTVSQ